MILGQCLGGWAVVLAAEAGVRRGTVACGERRAGAGEG